MLTICVLATIVAVVVAPPPPKQKVLFQPVHKHVPHEEPVLHGDKVPLLKQHPRVHKHIVTVVDQEAVIIKKPKAIIRENPIRVAYPVDKPIIQHKRIIKPIHKERTVVIKKPVDVPRPIVKTKTIGVPKPYVVHRPFKRVKTVTNVVERVQKVPKVIHKPDLKVVHRDRPFPVENLVIKKKPRVIEVPYDKPVPIVEEITNVVREPVAIERPKVVDLDHPVIVNRKVPYFPKGSQAGGNVLGGGGGGATVVIGGGHGGGAAVGGGLGGGAVVGGGPVIVSGGVGGGKFDGGVGGGPVFVSGGAGAAGGFGHGHGHGHGHGQAVFVANEGAGYGQGQGYGQQQVLVANQGAGFGYGQGHGQQQVLVANQGAGYGQQQQGYGPEYPYKK